MIKNILVTSAGRRVSLIKNFQQTAKKFNKSAKVFTTCMNPALSSACHISDGYLKVPIIFDRTHLDILKDFCKKNDISIIVPTIDKELILLSEAKDEFLEDDIFIAISSVEVCKTFHLKSLTEKFFIDNGFDTPSSIIDIENCKYPIFAKLNNSSNSIGAQIVYDSKVARSLSMNKNYFFQEFIEGDEFTVDTFINKNSEVISIVPRQRIEVRGGEVSKATTVKDFMIIESIKNLCKRLNGAYGCITIQLFKTEDKIVFIEINPRFGGGYPLSLHAGANFVEYLIKDYNNDKLEYSENWKENTLMLRYDAEVILDGKIL